MRHGHDGPATAPVGNHPARGTGRGDGDTPTWCHVLAVSHKHAWPYRPQTNGKVERFHRTMTAGWAFRRLYASESVRHNALPAWLHEYDHHRLHTAIGKATPISRLTNLPGQYT